MLHPTATIPACRYWASADNGSAWFVSGAPDARWNDDEVQGELRQLTGADFEAVDLFGLMDVADSVQVHKRP